MTRQMAKEILSQWVYQERIQVNLGEYGNADGDKQVAENILQFFENEKTCYKDLKYAEQRDDYQRFRCIFNLIEEEKDVEDSIG